VAIPDDAVLTHLWNKLQEADKRQLRLACKELKLRANKLVHTLTVRNSEWDILVPAAYRFPNLNKLMLHGGASPQGDKLMTAFRTSINGAPAFSGITHLHLRKCSPFSPELLDLLPSAMPALQHLSLTTCRLAVNTLAPLSSIRDLRSVELSDVDVSNCGGTQLQDLAAVSGLKEISLQYCNGMTREGVAALATLTNLESLTLIHCLPQLSDISLLAPLTKLTKLSTQHFNSKGDLSWQDQANLALSSLSDMRQLEELHLQGLTLTDAGVTALRELPHLTHLNVESVVLQEQPEPQASGCGGSATQPSTPRPLVSEDIEGLLPQIRKLGVVYAKPSHLLHLLGSHSQPQAVSFNRGIDVTCPGPSEWHAQDVAAELRTLMSWPVACRYRAAEVQLYVHHNLPCKTAPHAQRTPQPTPGPILRALEVAAPRLQHCMLSGMSLKKEDLMQLAAACPGLARVTFDDCTLHPGSLAALLGRLPALSAVAVSKCKGVGSSGEELAMFAARVPGPLELELSVLPHVNLGQLAEVVRANELPVNVKLI